MKKPAEYLIPEWKQSYRYLSNIFAAVTGVLATAYQYLPSIQQYFPEGWVKWAALAIIVGRVINQHSKE